MLLSVVVPVLAVAGSALGRLSDGRLTGNMAPPPIVKKVQLRDNGPRVHSRTGATQPPLDTVYTFDQLIDHGNPQLGTFKQRYWADWEFYEPGGPIVLFTPGEENGEGFEGYLTNDTMSGIIAQQHHGASVVIEHRFFGLSNPYPDLSVKSLKYHTIQQAIDDLDYFANNVKLPFSANVTPAETPWVLVGGSYSGALTAWTKVNKPDTFWAGWASSAVVESITDFWQYFDVIRQFMPQNCSADVQAVVSHFDSVVASGNTSAFNALKAEFGMADVVHPDDVTGALRNNLWDWQNLTPASNADALFWKFCDALEVKNGKIAPASGWGVEYALSAWGAYFKNTYLELLCGDQDAETCLGTYNASQSSWTDTTIDNASRSWEWIVCNEVGFFQDSAPAGTPSLVSNLVLPSGDERQCEMMFPEAFSSPPVPNVDKTNTAYGGWNAHADRLFYANAIRDPWRDATVSADNHTVQSTPDQPIAMSDGFHADDLIVDFAAVDATMAKLQQQGLNYIKGWLAEWKPASDRRRGD
ncbi:peptidase S28 [Dentipellis sp. KUC8613]|nr:peptidase S28 [Dentipellis sp. KUC8613]